MNNLLRMLSFFLLAASPAEAISTEYTLSFTQPQAHYVEVEMNVNGWKGGEMDLRMPVWTPGSYLVREFSRFVENVQATDSKGNSLRYVRSAKNGWKFNAPSGNVKIRYQVYAFELSVRTSFIDADHAYMNGSSIFMYVEGGNSWPCTLKINLPSAWKRISVALESKGTNSFIAENYDLLIDSPIEIGNHEVLEFTAAGVPHEVAIFGGGNYEAQRLIKDMKRIVEECTSIFGSNPCKRYLFIIHNLQSGGGGLEHSNSTTIQFNRFNYSNETSYTGLLSLIAHEYFHVWNVKRLRPVELGPFDYNNENYTSMLWFAEGFTAYYDDLIVRRCGFSSQDAYLGTLAGNFSYVVNTPGSKIQSLEEASHDAWIKYYRHTENTANNSVSYYTKGGVVGAIYDLSIREASSGTKSLDDVMKQLYKKYYLDNQGKQGITATDFRNMVNEVANKNLDHLYDRYIAGTDGIDYTAHLKAAGLQIADLNARNNTPWTGMTVSVKDGKMNVTAVERSSPAWNGGLNVNDEVLALNEYRSSDDLQKMLGMFKPGDQVKVMVSRAGMIREIPITISKSPVVKYSITPVDSPSETQKNILKNWLRL